MENSPLAKLPPELRNYIYKLALAHPEPLIGNWEGWPHRYFHRGLHSSQLALTAFASKSAP